jgi:hypothetical protein
MKASDDARTTGRMKIPLTIFAVVAALLGAYYVLRPVADPSRAAPRIDLPWQVTALPNGEARVFDLQLGQATLAEATLRFGPYEDMAVFVDRTGRKTLEAYFGTVQFGPLEAKVVVTLVAPEEELAALIARAEAREPAASGAWRYRPHAADRAGQERRRLAAISYIPTYGGLEADFFRERFGEPAAWQSLDAQRVRWFYPALGVSLLLDAAGREVIEYVAPRDMELPDGIERSDPMGSEAAPAPSRP